MYQPDALILDGRGKCKDSIPGILNGTIPNRLIIVRDSCMIEQEFVHQPALNQWLVDNGITSRRKLNDVQKYHQILQFLFVDLLFPLPSITDRVAAIKKELDWGNHYFIGMHIRSGLLEGNVGWGRFLEPQDVDFFISQAKQYTQRAERRGYEHPVKWLVLSDNSALRQRVKEEGKDYYVTTNCTLSHSKNANVAGMQCSLVENYLLSDCNMLMLTAKSTFGYLAKHRTEAPQVNVYPGTWKKRKTW